MMRIIIGTGRKARSISQLINLCNCEYSKHFVSAINFIDPPITM